jgi:DNA primase
MFDQFFIEDLRSRADILAIIEPYAPLKKKGANWMGCCPFHQEKTPSFSVNPQKGFYKCFGCGKGGTVYNFVMEIEGLSFPEAVERVARISGIPLPEPVDDKRYEESRKRRKEQKALSDRIIELNALALEFWEKQLAEADGSAAREYLANRGIAPETQRLFRIGFAPDSWDALLSHLRSKGAEDGLIEVSGLVSVNEEKKRVFDRFRGRIVFPVLDAEGRPVAFGARTLGAGEPKYLNSPETAAYVKGDHLYGLFQSKEEIRKKKYSILVEGYLDLIALRQAGVGNCVASLGTAFTERQARALKRFASKVVVNYDGDKAGVKAARRAIETLLAEDFEIKVLVLPDGSDPDDFVRTNGFEAYKEQHKTRAATYLQFVLDTAAQDRNLAVPKLKAEAIEEVMPVLSVIRNPIQKRESFDQAMNYFRVDDSLLKRDLWKSIKVGGRVEPENVRRQVARASASRMTVAESRLLELLIFDDELREVILPQLEETDYERLATANIFRAVFALQKSGSAITLESLLSLVEGDDTATDAVPVLMMSEPPREPDDAIDEVLHDAESCVFTLRSMAFSNRIVEISQELIAAEREGDFDRLGRLVSEQIDLARRKRSLETRIGSD